MSAVVKVQHKGQMTIPSSVRSAVGLVDGDVVEVKAAGGKIILTPKLGTDRSKFSATENEYTSAHRRVIDARLDEAEKGPYYGPFKSAAEVGTFLKKVVKKRAKSSKLKASR